MPTEAGAVLGAHRTGYETLLRNRALLSTLWDGGEMPVDRRSKPAFRLRGFLERARILPRGIGFIARFLIASPAGTQGTRGYLPGSAAMPAVDRFGVRVSELLEIPHATHVDSGLQPVELALSTTAQAAWVQAHDRIGRVLASVCELADIHDVATKAAENIARLAALFHVLAYDCVGVIDAEAVDAAASVISWHLHEARRLLSDLDTPSDLDTAIRLDN